MDSQETGNVIVQIRDHSYDPVQLSVAKGAEVQFINFDDELHSVTSKADGFDLELDAGESEKVVFNDVGTYDYYCRYHPEMQGNITVRED